MPQELTIIDTFLSTKPSKPLITIIGPTASGKTAFSIELAKDLLTKGLTAEIINADSRQFYRYLDIGTAKITEKEMDGVEHHLLSVLDPKQECSIAWFQKEATKLINEIHQRGHIPMLVGGSMLYVSAIIDGLKPLPPVDPKIRERLSKEFDADGGVALLRKLEEIDPETAASFPKENKVYMVRALEIYEATGKTKSSLRAKKASPYDLLILGIDRPREELKKRIDERTMQMLKSGWTQEVQSLFARGYSVNNPGMKSLGYREIAEFLQHVETPRRGVSTQTDVQDLSEKISSKVRAFAKRHQTWWKKDERVHWITRP